jgi:hypothetical protein
VHQTNCRIMIRTCFGRFGPNVLTWKTCKTPREFLYQGILQSSGYHIVSFAALLFWSAIGRPSPASFVRATSCHVVGTRQLIVLSSSGATSSFHSSSYPSSRSYLLPLGTKLISSATSFPIALHFNTSSSYINFSSSSVWLSVASLRSSLLP